jgi:sugar lactone lactonase YvrE
VLREGNSVYKVTPAGNIARIAGTGEKGYSGDGGPAITAKLNGPKGISVLGSDVYLADTENHVIRKVDLKTGLISTVVGDGQRGDGPDGDPAHCRLNRPHGIFVDKAGRVYIGDSENHRIRVLTPGKSR